MGISGQPRNEELLGDGSPPVPGRYGADMSSLVRQNLAVDELDALIAVLHDPGAGPGASRPGVDGRSEPIQVR